MSTTSNNTQSKSKHETLLTLLKEGKAEILAELSAAEEALSKAIEKVKSEHGAKIESLKETLVTVYNHKFPKSKSVASGKERKPRTKIDPVEIVSKIKSILAGGKKMNGSKLQKELGITYPTFKNILKNNPNLLTSKEEGVSVIYSLK